MSKRTKVTFSLILVICLLLSGLPSAAPVAATEADEPLTSPITESTATETQDVTEQTAAVTEETPVLQLDADCQIFSHVDPEVFAAGNHIARLPEQETLSSYVFLNADGSQTVYYMDQPVKFEKADGTVVDKNLTLTAATEGYTTTQNDIQLTIPTNPTNGIRLIYDSHQITLIPQGGTLTNAAQATDSSVTYPDYYGEGMSLRYTPTLSGVKEDILLDAYSGVNSFTFRLNTGGLNLYQANGRYFLAESKVSTDRIELGEVVTYDAKSKFSIGTMTAQTIMPGQAYMLTLTVDEAFLTDESTTYPVTIDPTLTVSYSNNGDNYIIDAPIFEGYPSKNYGAFQYNRVGYVDSSYQSGRTVVKLPVLTSSSIYSSLTADNITSVKFYVKEATGSSGISVSLYPLTSNSTWTETSVTWNNVGSRSSTALAEATLTDSAWSAFDITTLVQLWKSGGYNANCGFIMIGASEDSTDKSFCSSEHEKTSYRPYVVMTYNSGISLNYSAVNVDEGGSFTLTATTSPAGQTVTWTSSDGSVATVSSSGVVTAVKAGKVSIRATKSDGSFASCLVYVTVADGVYRISQSGLYLGTSGSISEHTPAELLVGQNSGVTYLAQLWKIKYISGGYYSIRPMHKLDMALSVASGSVCIREIGSSDTISSVPSSSRWTVMWTSSGYAFKNFGADSATMRCVATYPGADILTGTYSTSNSCFHWTLNKLSNLPNGVILYDTSTNRIVTNLTKSIRPGVANSLLSLGLTVAVYSGDEVNQNVTWTSSNTSVATVASANGAVTGVTYGVACITAYKTIDGTVYSQSYTLVVSEIPVSGSELAYEPELWNYSPVQQSTNCYAYALNNQLDPKNSAFGCNYTDYNPKQQPGEFYNANREATDPAIDISDFENDPSLLVTAVQKDYEMYNNLFGTDLIFMPIDRDATCPNGTYKVALYVRPSSSEAIADYHWYRQDADGLWSHKIGPTAAKQVDESYPGNLIVDPDTANRGGYSIFVGYFAISPWNHLYCATTTSEVEHEIAAISTSSTLTVSQAQTDSIELGMRIEQVIDIIGFAGSDIGSGIIIHEYTTYNGSQLLISYTMDSNGSFIVSKICNGISTSN